MSLKKKVETKALSIRQPWAWFIVNGYKDVENRSWKPSEKMMGQRIVIHASARKLTKTDFEEFVEICEDLKIKRFPKSVDDFVYGSYVGSAVITGAVKNSKSEWAARGSWHILLDKAKKMTPKKKKGQLGFFPFK